MDAGAKATGTFSCRPAQSGVETQMRFRDINTETFSELVYDR